MTHQAGPGHVGTYHYDAEDRQFLRERVEQFRDQVRRRLAGELSEEEFRPLRLMNGLYLQLHAYMLRIAVPYGVLSTRVMRRFAHIGRKYDRGYGHFTTRQNLQFHWIRLQDVPDILGELADVDMHAIQTSGNCIRNVTADQFAGVAPDEVVDPRVYAEILRQWSTLHPEFSFLPRKFKIAITGAGTDRAAIRVHDIGLIAKRNDNGETGFEVHVGGGLGRTPFVAALANRFVPEQDLIAYVEAVLRVYNRLGRRDNMFKARIKILVHEMGAEKFVAAVEGEFARMPREKFRLEPGIVAAIRQHYTAPPYQDLMAQSEHLARAKRENANFRRWVDANVSAHKQPGYAIATISLKPVGLTPGDISSDQMDALSDLADQFSFGEIRVTHEQNLVLAHVRQDDLFEVWQGLAKHELATPNLGLITDIIACPGLDYCALANARAISVAQAISTKFADPDRQKRLGELKIKISGCINACGHHHVGHIGILGVDKKGEEFYQLTLAGSAADDAAVGQILGHAFAHDEVAGAVETLVTVFERERQGSERFIDTVRRTGLGPFKEALYGAA